MKFNVISIAVLSVLSLSACQSNTVNYSAPKQVVNKDYVKAKPAKATDNAVVVSKIEKPATILAEISQKTDVKLKPIETVKISEPAVVLKQPIATASTNKNKQQLVKPISLVKPVESSTRRDVLSTASRLSKQTTTPFPFLRVNKLDYRLSFNNESKEFTFKVTPTSLESNLSNLLAKTANTTLIFKPSSGHEFPNAFYIKGKTVLELSDQLLRPFVRPSTLHAEVHPNNLIVVNYEGS
ncbi:hypothetical protein [Photobacterium sp. GB-72]|uniref:hypothetical protein n=1 Tax=Photobacterium sp. GB-72 TaxID=2022105 RepID=UPI000D16E4A4|nr:hypothetical protein [Photobacterium sp. GB-72]PSV27662.1 hypothetical protein C9J40_20210 [Photobacterium sp. GB-72]